MKEQRSKGGEWKDILYRRLWGENVTDATLGFGLAIMPAAFAAAAFLVAAENDTEPILPLIILGVVLVMISGGYITAGIGALKRRPWSAAVGLLSTLVVILLLLAIGGWNALHSLFPFFAALHYSYEWWKLRRERTLAQKRIIR